MTVSFDLTVSWTASVGLEMMAHLVVLAQLDEVVEKGVAVEVLALAVPIGDSKAGLFVAVTQLLLLEEKEAVSQGSVST